MSKKVEIREDQNIFDLAIQETGSAEGAFDIISQNEEISSLDHVFEFGDSFIIDETTPQDKNVRDFYKLNIVIPTTGEEDAFVEDSFNNDFNNDFK